MRECRCPKTGQLETNDRLYHVVLNKDLADNLFLDPVLQNGVGHDGLHTVFCLAEDKGQEKKWIDLRGNFI